jgi:hypothetical protein
MHTLEMKKKGFIKNKGYGGEGIIIIVEHGMDHIMEGWVTCL